MIRKSLIYTFLITGLGLSAFSVPANAARMEFLEPQSRWSAKNVELGGAENCVVSSAYQGDISLKFVKGPVGYYIGLTFPTPIFNVGDDFVADVFVDVLYSMSSNASAVGAKEVLIPVNQGDEFESALRGAQEISIGFDDNLFVMQVSDAVQMGRMLDVCAQPDALEIVEPFADESFAQLIAEPHSIVADPAPSRMLEAVPDLPQDLSALSQSSVEAPVRPSASDSQPSSQSPQDLDFNQFAGRAMEAQPEEAVEPSVELYPIDGSTQDAAALDAMSEVAAMEEAWLGQDDVPEDFAADEAEEEFQLVPLDGGEQGVDNAIDFSNFVTAQQGAGMTAQERAAFEEEWAEAQAIEQGMIEEEAVALSSLDSAAEQSDSGGFWSFLDVFRFGRSKAVVEEGVSQAANVTADAVSMIPQPDVYEGAKQVRQPMNETEILAATKQTPNAIDFSNLEKASGFYTGRSKTFIWKEQGGGEMVRIEDMSAQKFLDELGTPIEGQLQSDLLRSANEAEAMEEDQLAANTADGEVLPMDSVEEDDGAIDMLMVSPQAPRSSEQAVPVPAACPQVPEVVEELQDYTTENRNYDESQELIKSLKMQISLLEKEKQAMRMRVPEQPGPLSILRSCRKEQRAIQEMKLRMRELENKNFVLSQSQSASLDIDGIEFTREEIDSLQVLVEELQVENQDLKQKLDDLETYQELLDTYEGEGTPPELPSQTENNQSSQGFNESFDDLESELEGFDLDEPVTDNLAQ